MAQRKTPHPQTCERCPHRFSEVGCPCWVGPEAGLLETNIATGEERMVTGCFYAVLPRLLIHVIRASNRPAAAMESLRNGVSRVAGLIAEMRSPALEGPKPHAQERSG